MGAWNKGKKGWTNNGSFKKGHVVPQSWRDSVGKATKQRIEMNGGIWTGKHPAHLQREHHPRWKGGITVNHHGYIYIRKDGEYKRENRFIMEKYLGRELYPKEVVHHINGNVKDNRIENLMLFSTDAEHKKFEWQNKRKGSE